MLNLDSQYKVTAYFKDMAARELEIERQRQILAELQDFEPYAAFCRLNRHGDKRVSAQEIRQFLV